jgi:signal transduction histidine kinase
VNSFVGSTEETAQRDLVTLQESLQILINNVERQRAVLDQLDPAQPGTPQADLHQSLEEMATLLPRLFSCVDQFTRERRAQQRERGELAALFHVTQVVNSSLDLNQVLNQVMDHIIQLTKAERGFLMLINDDGELEFKVARNMDRTTIEGSSFSISRTIVQRVAEKRQPVVTTNARQDPRFRAQESVVSYKLRSILCVPLRVKDKVTGVIYVDNRIKSGIFGDHHREPLTAFANQAAIAIENARLFFETQRRAEELATALTRQEELDRLKSEFIQNVSHELRTPLAIIRGYTELLENDELGKLQPAQHKALSIIARRSHMLTRLVDDFATIQETETRAIRRERVNLAELAHAMLADFEIAAQEAELSLTAEVPPDLALVYGIPAHLQRVLDNLLTNAVKFTPAGGSVAVRIWQEKGDVILEVADTGVGIPSDQLERIFERFYQIDGSTTRRYGGTGLGLALVKEVVEAHGGQVTVTSTLGQGSTFRVTLPGTNPP